MKTNENIKSIVLTALALVVASLAARADETMGENKSEGSISGNRLVERVIELHAPNSSTPTVTVWVPETRPLVRDIETATGQSYGKEISLPASNGSAASVTVWCEKK